MTLFDQLRLLIRLQAMDKTLFDLGQERDVIPGRLADLTQAEQALQSQLEAQQTQLDQMLKRKADLDEIADNVRARLRRAENRLMGSKSGKEYQAANAEIDDGKDSLKDAENQLLEVMEQVEALEKKVADLKERHDQLAASSKEERTQLEERYHNTDTEISRLIGSREKLASEIDKGLMKDYDFIRQARDGVALAAVSEGTCTVCHMTIPPQQFNELQRMDKIMSCPSCRRLIYWAEAEQLKEDQ
jgi:predicted  nucleic acid-binding Zn-ribbon protein